MMFSLLAMKASLMFLAAANACAVHSFFFLPPWYEYLKLSPDAQGQCTPVFNFPGDMWLVGLAIVHLLLSIAGIAAVASIMIAGFEYLSTQGNAEKGVAARKRVVNSIIGLAIVFIAASLVTFIGKKLGA